MRHNRTSAAPPIDGRRGGARRCRRDDDARKGDDPAAAAIAAAVWLLLQRARDLGMGIRNLGFRPGWGWSGPKSQKCTAQWAKFGWPPLSSSCVRADFLDFGGRNRAESAELNFRISSKKQFPYFLKNNVLSKRDFYISQKIITSIIEKRFSAMPEWIGIVFAIGLWTT